MDNFLLVRKQSGNESKAPKIRKEPDMSALKKLIRWRFAKELIL